MYFQVNVILWIEIGRRLNTKHSKKNEYLDWFFYVQIYLADLKKSNDSSDVLITPVSIKTDNIQMILQLSDLCGSNAWDYNTTW